MGNFHRAFNRWSKRVTGKPPSADDLSIITCEMRDGWACAEREGDTAYWSVFRGFGVFSTKRSHGLTTAEACDALAYLQDVKGRNVNVAENHFANVRIMLGEEPREETYRKPSRPTIYLNKR